MNKYIIHLDIYTLPKYTWLSLKYFSYDTSKVISEIKAQELEYLTPDLPPVVTPKTTTWCLKLGSQNSLPILDNSLKSRPRLSNPPPHFFSESLLWQHAVSAEAFCLPLFMNTVRFQGTILNTPAIHIDSPHSFKMPLPDASQKWHK